MDQLLQLGVHKVPFIAVGQRTLFAQSLKDVAAFLDIPMGRELLPPDQLVAKYLDILAAALRMVRQIPEDKLDEPVISNRPRVIRPFTGHIFRIAEAFLLSWEGAEFSENMTQLQPPVDRKSGAETAAYGEKVRDGLAHWWETTDDKNCRKIVHTYYGTQAAHDVLERCTWHSAQHCRQLAAILDRYGIRADGPPTPVLLAGLPLPEGLWE
jgi:hypothetical protein